MKCCRPFYSSIWIACKFAQSVKTRLEGADPAAAGAEAGASAESGSDEEVVDAEFSEVDDSKS